VAAGKGHPLGRRWLSKPVNDNDVMHFRGHYKYGKQKDCSPEYGHRLPYVQPDICI